MRLELSNEERNELKQLHRETKNPKKRDQIKAVLMKANGYTYNEIAEVLLHEESMRRWVKSYMARDDIEQWIASQYKGYKGSLSHAQQQEVEHYLEHTIVSDSKEVALYILKEWGVSYSTSGIVALQKTTLTPSKHNPADQKACKEAYEKRVESLFENEAILFLDGTHPQHNTLVSHPG